MDWFNRKNKENKGVNKVKPYKPTTELGKLEIWFARNHSSTGFDCSATGFHNFIKNKYPHLLKR